MGLQKTPPKVPSQLLLQAGGKRLTLYPPVKNSLKPNAFDL
jgi:hypothetical protein